MTKFRWAAQAALVLLVVVVIGCTTRNNAFEQVDKSVEAREYDPAIKLLNENKNKALYKDNEKVLQNLDVGTLQHLKGDSKASSKAFSEAERLIEEYFTKSITNQVASFLLNDTVLDYSGEDYEDLYLNVFKAIDYSRLKDFDGSFVEVRRMGTKLNLLEDKYAKLANGMNANKDSGGNAKAGKTEFHNSALARYLSMLLYRADDRGDDATIDFKQLQSAFKTQASVYNFAQPKLESFFKPTTKARLNLIAFTGKAPIKRAYNLRLTTGRGVVAVSIEKEDDQGKIRTTQGVSIPFPSDQFLTFKAQLPEMKLTASKVDKIVVSIDGNVVTSPELLESLENVALETYKVKEPLIYTKTVVRTVVKGIAVSVASHEVKKQAGILGDILGIVGSAAADASEQADLRSARFFPGKAWVAEYEVEPGKHEITVQYLDKGGNVLLKNTSSETVDKKGLNLVPSYALL